MKNVILPLILALSFVAAPAFAGQDERIESEREILRAERQMVVAKNLALDEREGDAFWPVYKAYEAERTVIGSRKLALIKEYAAHHENLGDARATRLAREALAVEVSRETLKQKYFKRFAAVLSGKKLARFYQVEHRLDALLDVALSEQIPLVK